MTVSDPAALLPEESIEQLGNGVSLIVSPDNHFGTDALVLADFVSGSRRRSVSGPICDFGTGCGIIPLLLYRNGIQSDIWGIDIQPAAVEQFSRSLLRNGSPDRLHAVCADLRALPPSIPKNTFQTVIMNPPYKPAGTGILSDRPADRIARHETSCTIEDVVSAAAALLTFSGKLFLCGRPERLADVMTAFRTGSIEPKRLRLVQKRPDTAPWLFLLEGRKGGKPYLNVEAPLFIQDEHGNSSEELKRIIGPYSAPDNE